MTRTGYVAPSASKSAISTRLRPAPRSRTPFVAVATRAATDGRPGWRTSRQTLRQHSALKVGLCHPPATPTGPVGIRARCPQTCAAHFPGQRQAGPGRLESRPRQARSATHPALRRTHAIGQLFAQTTAARPGRGLVRIAALPAQPAACRHLRHGPSTRTDHWQLPRPTRETRPASIRAYLSRAKPQIRLNRRLAPARWSDSTCAEHQRGTDRKQHDEQRAGRGRSECQPDANCRNGTDDDTDHPRDQVRSGKRLQISHGSRTHSWRHAEW